MIKVDVKQGSPEWFQEKLGKPSASNASKIITSTGKASTSREGYLHTLAAERLTGKVEEGYKNEYMEMGNEREQESREAYELISGDEIEQVGVVYADEGRKYLCSPDGLCEKKGYGLELKNVLPKTMVKYLLKNVVPTEYVVQVQFSLMVTGLDHWMFFAYSPGLSPLMKRVGRDDNLIGLLKTGVGLFCHHLDGIVAQLRDN